MSIRGNGSSARRGWAWMALVLPVLLLVTQLAACSTSTPPASGGGTISVVAAENFWGSIAAQVGGNHVHVTNIITSPDTDPHSYEPTSGDARAFAVAQYAIVNGAGYDVWAQKALDTNPGSGRKELDVGKLAGRKEGDNPHMWYSPAIVTQVANQITADLKGIDAADATYFDQQNAAFKTQALKGYSDLIAAIKAKYAGTPVGATESIQRRQRFRQPGASGWHPDRRHHGDAVAGRRLVPGVASGAAASAAIGAGAGYRQVGAVGRGRGCAGDASIGASSRRLRPRHTLE